MNNTITTSAIVQRALAFDMSDVILRYESSHRVPHDIALQHERELKRFLILCALNPQAAYGMPEPVDTLWHEFIIFTSAYVKFCHLVAGRYLHHKSRLPGRSRTEQETVEMYRRFKADYVEVFNESAPRPYWSMNFECSHIEPDAD